jgi:hypothetical protein
VIVHDGEAWRLNPLSIIATVGKHTSRTTSWRTTRSCIQIQAANLREFVGEFRRLLSGQQEVAALFSPTARDRLLHFGHFNLYHGQILRPELQFFFAPHFLANAFQISASIALAAGNEVRCSIIERNWMMAAARTRGECSGLHFSAIQTDCNGHDSSSTIEMAPG